MAPLKSLEKEYPLIDSIFQSFCASHAIFSGSLLFPYFFSFQFHSSLFSELAYEIPLSFSVEDFLLHDIDALIALADNHCASQTLKQVRVT